MVSDHKRVNEGRRQLEGIYWRQFESPQIVKNAILIFSLISVFLGAVVAGSLVMGISNAAGNNQPKTDWLFPGLRSIRG